MFQTISGEQAGCPPAKCNRLSSSVGRKPSQPNRKHEDQQNTDKNVGREIPTSDKPISQLAQIEFLFRATKTPNGIPMSVATIAEKMQARASPAFFFKQVNHGRTLAQ